MSCAKKCRRGASDIASLGDDRGRNVRSQSAPALLFILFIVLVLGISRPVFAQAPQRIISLKPNITEILFALGVGDRVVGVTKYCDYPPAAKALPRVADYIKPFTERVIEAAPDLIVGSRENTSKKAIWQLERMGYRVELFPFATVGQTLDSIERLGTTIGRPRAGAELARRIGRELDVVRTRHAGGDAARILIVWGHRPLVVTGPGSFMDELVKLVGATNVASRGSMRYPHWSSENVIAADPEVIIDMGMGSETKAAYAWDRLNTVSAVKAGRVFTLDDSLFRAGPRLPHAVEELAKAIYGDVSLRERGRMPRGMRASR